MLSVSQIIVAQLDDPDLLWNEFTKWRDLLQDDIGRDDANQKSAEYLGFLDKAQLRNYVIDLREKNKCTHTK